MKTNDAEASEIDFSDIAEMTDEQLAQLQPSHLQKSSKLSPC